MGSIVTNETTRRTSAKADNFVEIFTEDDFGPLIGGMHETNNRWFMLMAPVVLNNPININGGGTIASDNGSVNKLIYDGPGALFRATDLVTGFGIEDIIIDGNFANTLFDVVSFSDPFATMVFHIALCEFFADLGTIEGVPFITSNIAQFIGFFSGLKFKNIPGLIDTTTLSFFQLFDSGTAYMTFEGTFANININLSPSLSLFPNESFLDIRPDIIFAGGVFSGSTLNGPGDFFKQGITGSYTVLADSATEPGVKTTVTSAAHGQLDGQSLKIKGSTSLAYNGGYAISNVTANTFDIPVVFTITETGIWDTGSLDQTNPQILALLNGRQADSQIVGGYGLSSNAVVTPITVIGQWEIIAGTTTQGTAVERTFMTANNELTLLQVQNITISLEGGIFATTTAAASTDYEFAFFKNGVIVNTTFTTQTAITSKGQTMQVTAMLPVETNDVVNIRVRNTQDTRDITVGFLNVRVFRVG